MQKINLNITNPNKIIDKNIKKIDVLNYYYNISDLILPFLKERPISEVVCHNGLSDHFFRKHPSGKHQLPITISSKEELLGEVQLGAIEFHPAGNTFDSVEKANIMIFDLDPDDKLELKKIRQGAIHLKTILDKLNLTSFLKTSGGKGYHIVVPFSNSCEWETFSQFSKMIALIMEKTYPSLYTTSIRKLDRKGKIFIDYLRNKKGATCVAPYSLRARPILPVSIPIAWDDLTKIKPNEVTIKNIDKFLETKPWKNFYKTKNSITINEEEFSI